MWRCYKRSVEDDSRERAQSQDRDEHLQVHLDLPVLDGEDGRVLVPVRVQVACPDFVLEDSHAHRPSQAENPDR